MDTDVLIVGAGPTGLMLANQLARRGVRASIIDRHAGPAHADASARRAGAHAGDLRQARRRRSRARARQAREPARICGRRDARWRAFRWAMPGASVTPYPYILILGQDDNERIMGDRLRDFGMSVQWNTELVGLTQQDRRVDGDAQAARRHDADDDGRVGRRLRRRAQRGARALRHHVPGRALRARVLRRRHGGDRQHGGRRGQRLPVAQRLPSVLPDARQGPLAHRRHPARRPARAATTSNSTT